MPDVSVIIPARREELLARTVRDVLDNARGDTEVIVVCDASWPDPPLPDHPKVTVLHYTEPVGQRGAVNRAARLSSAKYIMKLDAHCAVAPGFDLVLMEDCRPDWTLIPSLHNLHAFDWECAGCGARVYQGSMPSGCEKCNGSADWRVKWIWKPRHRRPTVSWRFDSDMQFQYWRSHHKRPEWKDEPLVETLACNGPCFFMHRERFWQVGGMDEAHGSWGQFGVELACKAWLSGGKMMTTRRTWFAHLFRTGNFRRNGESTFPWPYDCAQVENARRYSRDLWLNDRWPGAVKPLSWLVERFWPVDGWSDEDLAKLKGSA